MSKKDEQSLAFGGQALIEGVMMRSGSQMVMCVRQPDNEINVSYMKCSSRTKSNKVLGLPFIRGVILLGETMYYGMKSLMHSANVALEEEDESFETKDYIILVVMVLVMNGLFIAIPFILTSFLKLSGALFNIVESAMRISLFSLYLYGISQWGEVNRIFQYHGAEHKTINAYEAGDELTVENVARHSNLNPRCGTSFLFLTMLVSIVLFSMIPRTTYLLRLATRLLLIPVIAAISYEVLKYSDKHRNNVFMKLIIKPGLAFQLLTTMEPTSDMIEVAIKSLEEVKQLNKN